MENENLINVEFMDLGTGCIVSVELDSIMTCQEVIGELIANSFISQFDGGYMLILKGKPLENSQTLTDGGVKNNDLIHVRRVVYI